MGENMEEGAQLEKPRFCAFLDRMILGMGRVVSWLSIALIAAILVQVILRYVFGRGVIVLEELQWHIYGVILILAISYTLVTDGHIRLDLLHARFKRRTKEKVEFFGIIFLLMPMVIVIFFHSLEFVADSWRVNEGSDAPMGICCRWAFKAFMPLGIGLLGLAGISRMVRAFVFLRKSPKESE
jgi:TRAP-type mannitol/chloroaromatic compound transport system permease small subunit